MRLDPADHVAGAQHDVVGARDSTTVQVAREIAGDDQCQSSSAEPPDGSCGAGFAAIGRTSARSSRIGVSQIAGSSRSAARGVAHVPSDLPTTVTRPDIGSAPATSDRRHAIVCSSDAYAGGSHQSCSTRQPCWSGRTVKNSSGAIGGYPRPRRAPPSRSRRARLERRSQDTRDLHPLRLPRRPRGPYHVRFRACNAPLCAPGLRHVGALGRVTKRYKGSGRAKKFGVIQSVTRPLPRPGGTRSLDDHPVPDVQATWFVDDGLLEEPQNTRSPGRSGPSVGVDWLYCATE